MKFRLILLLWCWNDFTLTFNTITLDSISANFKSHVNLSRKNNPQISLTLLPYFGYCLWNLEKGDKV